MTKMQLKRRPQPVGVRDGRFVGKSGHGKFFQRKPGHF